MLRREFLIFNIFILLTLSLAGVYPNFRVQYDFEPIDDNKIVKLGSNDDWWKSANLYQIYPRSFKDSGSNSTLGVGDLKGIISKLPYLKEIGVTATWLSPIFKSPMKDFGYDISNYIEIDPLFGTMKDFDELVKVAKEVGIKIILDFVPNHSSDEHEWFKKSIKKEAPYDNYYVWHKGRPDPDNPKKNLPPSNWVSMFRGPAWTYVEERGEYYLHQFGSFQPDFNFENKAVHTEMENILKFWLDKGVDGFRIDAVPFAYECAKDEDGNFIDEEKNANATDPDDYGYLNHTCTVNQPETLQLVYDWRKFIDVYQKNHKTETKILLTEAWSPIEIVMKYYGDENGQLGSHVPFNFFVIEKIDNKSDAKVYADTINSWLEKMPKDAVPNWVLGNHDKNRVGSRMGSDRIDMMNMMLMTLPGVAITYQGEEIGMTDVWISWKDTVDPQACNGKEENYERMSRDPERTPFQWNDEKNGGFSNADKTWLPVAKNYDQVNVKRERMVGRSALNVYKALRALRNEPAFKDNVKADVKSLGNANVLAILRSDGQSYYVTVMNVKDGVESIDLKTTFSKLPDNLEYAVVSSQSPHSFGEKVSAKDIVLLGKESVVLRSIANKGALDDYYHYNIIN